jgi:hypothetical protein
MKHLQIENGTCEIVRETEKAFCLKNADNWTSRNITAWFPKSALIETDSVQWANGEVVVCYEIAKWFYNKATAEHDVVIGNAI